MTNDKIKRKIMDIAEEIIGIPLCEEEPLKESGVDSLSLVALIVSIEEVFRCSFSDDDLQPEKLQDLQSLALLVEKYT